MNDWELQEARASTILDWETYYGSRNETVAYEPVDTSDFRNFPQKSILDAVTRHFSGGSIIEIGAGDSDLLIELCRRLRPTECTGLDYLEKACERLSAKASLAGVNIDTVCADMFDPPEALKGKFSLVMSYGVVEHFHHLPEVLRAIAQFASRDGVIFTLIPNNKNTVYGWLLRRWNVDVYNAHVMYDARDLDVAHAAAGLELIEGARYLGSSNFGILSWCFSESKKGPSYWLYRQLTRLSKVVWLIESKIGPIHPIRIFAPYVVCVSRVAR